MGKRLGNYTSFRKSRERARAFYARPFRPSLRLCSCIVKLLTFFFFFSFESLRDEITNSKGFQLKEFNVITAGPPGISIISLQRPLLLLLPRPRCSYTISGLICSMTRWIIMKTRSSGSVTVHQVRPRWPIVLPDKIRNNASNEPPRNTNVFIHR